MSGGNNQYFDSSMNPIPGLGLGVTTSGLDFSTLAQNLTTLPQGFTTELPHLPTIPLTALSEGTPCFNHTNHMMPEMTSFLSKTTNDDTPERASKRIKVDGEWTWEKLWPMLEAFAEKYPDYNRTKKDKLGSLFLTFIDCQGKNDKQKFYQFLRDNPDPREPESIVGLDILCRVRLLLSKSLDVRVRKCLNDTQKLIQTESPNQLHEKETSSSNTDDALKNQLSTQSNLLKEQQKEIARLQTTLNRSSCNPTLYIENKELKQQAQLLERTQNELRITRGQIRELKSGRNDDESKLAKAKLEEVIITLTTQLDDAKRKNNCLKQEMNLLKQEMNLKSSHDQNRINELELECSRLMPFYTEWLIQHEIPSIGIDSFSSLGSL